MYNIIYQNYDKLKPKRKKLERTLSYDNQLTIMLSQIVRIDGIEELEIDQDILNAIKLTDGIAGITKINDKFYTVFDIMPAGMPRKDGRPYKVVGSYLDEKQNIFVKEFINDVDIVLLYNNSTMTAETNIEYFAYMFTEVDTSLQSNVAYSRLNPFLKAKSDIQKKEFEKAMEKSHDGELTIVVDGNKDLFATEEDAVINITDVKNVDKIQYLSHFHDDLLKRFCNLYGVSMNQTSKQAQQSVEEVQGMESASWLLCIDMLNQAKEFCKRFEKLYSIILSAHFGIVHELNFTKFTNTCTSNEDMDEDVCEDEENLQDDEEKLQEDKDNSQDDESEDDVDE